MLKLYSYFRSSASFRVRIALHLKELQFEYVPIHLLKDGGQQHSASYRLVNPSGHVPALDHDGFLVAESMAILFYLDDTFPMSPLFPLEPRKKALVMQICELVNSGIQPLQNLKVNQALEKQFGLNAEQVKVWNQHWIKQGFISLEKILEKTSGTFCLGDQITAAECFLIPQCFTARRFGVELEEYPLIAKVEAGALKIPAFQNALPDKQPDFSA